MPKRIYEVSTDQKKINIWKRKMEIWFKIDYDDFEVFSLPWNEDLKYQKTRKKEISRRANGQHNKLRILKITLRPNITLSKVGEYKNSKDLKKIIHYHVTCYIYFLK